MNPLSFSPSTYIIHRNPVKFGGQQDDYKERSTAAIEKALSKTHDTPLEEKQLTSLFFNLLTDFSEQRQTIALDHQTPKAVQFGRLRAEKGEKDFYQTYLDDVYKDYNQRMLKVMAEHLRVMNVDKKNEQIQKRRVVDQASDSSFEIEVLEGAHLQQLGWNRSLTPPEMPSGFPLALLEKRMQSSLTQDEKYLLKSEIQKLKKTDPDLYKRLKMVTLLFKLNNEFPSPKVVNQGPKGVVIDGKEGNLKSFFALATVRILVDGKRYAASQYLTWLYRDFKNHPVDRMLHDSTVSVIHQDNSLINDTLQEIAKIFSEVIQAKQNDLEKIKASVGKFRFYFAHAMPCERGSAAIGEWFEALLYRFHGYDIKYTPNKMVDLEALTTPNLSEFLNNYNSMITLSSGS